MMSPTVPVRCTVTVTIPDAAIGSVNDVGSVVIVKSPAGKSSSPFGGPPTDPHATTARAHAHFAIHPGEDICQSEYRQRTRGEHRFVGGRAFATRMTGRYLSISSADL